MKKRIVAFTLLAVMLLGMLTACGKKSALTQEEAQKIALEHAGISQEDVSDMHVHIVQEQGIPCYSFHISSEKGDCTVLVHAGTGEILSTKDSISH